MKLFQTSLFNKRDKAEGDVSSNEFFRLKGNINTFIKLTKDGCIVEAGEDFYKFTGYVERNVFLKSFLTYLTPRSSQIFKEGLSQLSQEQPLVSLKLSLRTKAEKLVAVEIILNWLSPWNDANVLAVVRNLEIEKENHFQLLEEQEHYKFLVEYNSFPQIILDDNWECIYANGAFSKLISQEGADLQGFVFQDFVHRSSLKDIWSIIDKISSIEDEVFDLKLTDKEYNLIPVNIRMHRCINDFGQTQNYILNILDLSSMNQLQKELDRAKCVADAANKMKNSFLGIISHELRTPLNAIIGFSTILRKRNQEKENEKLLQSIETNGFRLMEMIDNLLDFSLLENGEYKAINADTDLDHFFQKLSDKINGEFIRHPKSTIEISNELKLGELSSVLYTDRHILGKIFMNLIDNAIKFTPDGYIKYGCVRNEEREYLFYVEDSGIGIPDDCKERVFEKFTQADQSASRQYEGSGLGLTVSKLMVELLGGKMNLFSEHGKGTKCYFTIPA